MGCRAGSFRRCMTRLPHPAPTPHVSYGRRLLLSMRAPVAGFTSHPAPTHSTRKARFRHLSPHASTQMHRLDSALRRTGFVDTYWLRRIMTKGGGLLCTSLTMLLFACVRACVWCV